MRLRLVSLVALVVPFAAAGCDFSMHTSTSASAAVPAAPPSPSPLAGPGMLWMDGLRLEGR